MAYEEFIDPFADAEEGDGLEAPGEVSEEELEEDAEKEKPGVEEDDGIDELSLNE